MKRLIFILFGLWIMALGLCGQETIVVGEVYDANTGEPLSNVNIYLQGTQEGTTTNAEGMFLLREELDPKAPVYMSYKIHVDNDSMYNTPNTWSIYCCGKVFKYLLDNGGLEAMKKKTKKRQLSCITSWIRASSSPAPW